MPLHTAADRVRYTRRDKSQQTTDATYGVDIAVYMILRALAFVEAMRYKPRSLTQADVQKRDKLNQYAFAQMLLDHDHRTQCTH